MTLTNEQTPSAEDDCEVLLKASIYIYIFHLFIFIKTLSLFLSLLKLFLMSGMNS